MMSRLAVIVLAAGKGTRMRSDCPKVLHLVADRPMALRVLAATEPLQPEATIVVLAPGMTAPNQLAELVRERRADLGMALDGDADRVVLVDEQGSIIDGDQMLALTAASWHARGALRGGAVVATVMSNMGLERFLKAWGLDLLRTPVGDRYVGERTREVGCNLEGEQSGHMIMSDFGTTGDGLIAALQVLAVLVERKQPASRVLRCFEPLLQRLMNVRYAGASPLRGEGLQAEIKGHEERLGDRGRVLIRASGTEPLINHGLMDEAVQTLADPIRRRAAAVSQPVAAE